MAYNEKAILRDVNDKPIPQYWNPETNQSFNLGGDLFFAT